MATPSAAPLAGWSDFDDLVLSAASTVGSSRFGDIVLALPQGLHLRLIRESLDWLARTGRLAA